MTLPDRIAAHFAQQAETAAALGSAFTARLWRALPDAVTGAVRERLAAWPGDPGADLPANRIAAGLHALARAGACPEVTAAWPPGTGDLDAALAAAMERHQADLLPWFESAPQTNEVARSGVLLGMALTVAARTGKALELLEIGSSAGLNLGFDTYAYDLGAAGRRGDGPVRLSCDWRGAWPDPQGPLTVEARAGCDLNPADPGDPDQRARMLAWIWADQTDRLGRAEAACAAAAAAPWRVERADAADWVEDRLSRPQAPGTVRVLMHSVMWQYLPGAIRTRITAAMEAAGARATADAPLAWMRMEADGRQDGAAMLLTLWPGGAPETLGRAGWHGAFADFTG